MGIPLVRTTNSKAKEFVKTSICLVFALKNCLAEKSSASAIAVRQYAAEALESHFFSSTTIFLTWFGRFILETVTEDVSVVITFTEYDYCNGAPRPYSYNENESFHT